MQAPNVNISSGTGFNTPSSFGSGLNAASSAFNIYNGLNRGGVSGYGGAATAGASLYNQVYGNGNGAAIPYVGPASNILGIYNGIKQGGVMGYGGAAINAANLANQAGLLGSGAGGAIPILGAGLATYNAINNWKSGATGSDALNGAEAGASIGTAVLPGVGTAVGALIGGAAGAISSAFGPGKMDPENTNWDSYAASFDKQGAGSVAAATPSQNFQALAGIFDSRGTSIPFYNQFGRMGEGQFSQAMFGQINSAISSGTLPKNATAAQIYSQVVQPWITQMGGKNGWANTSTSTGYGEKDAIGNLLTNFIGQWQAGQITSNTPLGINGQKMTVPAYAGTAMQYSPDMTINPQLPTVPYQPRSSASANKV